MKPSIWNVYCNGPLIIQALEHAGFQAAHQRVTSLMRSIIQYQALDRALRSYVKSNNQDYSFLERILSKRSKNQKYDIMSLRKEIAITNRSLIPTRHRHAQLGKMIENKINQWPDLDLDIKTLKRVPDRQYLSQRHWSMVRRNQRVLVDT